MEYTIAKSWNELNEWQLKKIAKLLLSNTSKKVLKYRLVLYLFIEKPTLWKYIKLGIIVFSVPLKELYKYVTFLIEKSDRTKFPEYLHFGSLKLKGPADRLSSLTIDQFSFADMLYYRWSTNKDEIELDRLVSALYFPEDKPFSRDQSALAHSAIIPKIPLDQKLAVLLAYIGSREYIVKSFSYIFPQSKGKTKTKGGGYHSFDAIINKMSLSVPQPFGDFYKTKVANLYDFMTLYNIHIQEHKENEKRNEQR